MLEMFSYTFMVRALIAGVLVAITVPVLGSFLVTRRYALITDSLAHVSLAGIGAGLLLGFAPITLAIPVTITGALVLEWLRSNHKISGEISLAILMSSGLAIAVVLANLAHGANTDFTAYLFGSIATTTLADIIALTAVATVTLSIIGLKYRTLLHIAYDEDSARIAGYRVTALNYLMTALTAVVVVLSLRIVGGLLISALLVMPVITASRFARSFAGTVLLAVIAALIAIIIGLTIAFYAGIAAGGAIVLTALVLLLLALIWRR